MLVRVLLFGPEAAALGEDAVAIEVPEGATCDLLKAALAQKHPGIRALLASARFAVNSEFAAPDRAIKASDEVALIGLVSGG